MVYDHFDETRHIIGSAPGTTHPDRPRFLAGRRMEAHGSPQYLGHERNRGEHPESCGRRENPPRAEIRWKSASARRHGNDPACGGFRESPRTEEIAYPTRHRAWPA